jgi:hypothetical protein
MPKALPPAPLPQPVYVPFALPAEAYSSIAKYLSLPHLVPSAVQAVEHLVACFKAGCKLPGTTTIGGSIAFIDGLLDAIRVAEKAWRPGLVIRSAIDRDTLSALKEIAERHLIVNAQLRAALETRREELLKHPKVNPRIEKVSIFASRLKIFFVAVERGDAASRSARLHAFLLIVLEAAGVRCESYRAHPDRLEAADGGWEQGERLRMAREWRWIVDCELLGLALQRS